MPDFDHRPLIQADIMAGIYDDGSLVESHGAADPALYLPLLAKIIEAVRPSGMEETEWMAEVIDAYVNLIGKEAET